MRSLLIEPAALRFSTKFGMTVNYLSNSRCHCHRLQAIDSAIMKTTADSVTCLINRGLNNIINLRTIGGLL
jgi:hypothetical protein